MQNYNAAYAHLPKFADQTMLAGFQFKEMLLLKDGYKFHCRERKTNFSSFLV